MSAHRWRQRGMAMAIAVIALILAGISVFSMLFFSGSQTRSLHHDLDGWQAREFALSGLQVASDRLRQGRWYASGSLVGVLRSKIGRGGYVVVCEDMRRFKEGRLTWRGVTYDRLAVLDRVDVFVRGFCGDRSTVMYGRFIMCPEPAFLGTSTNGLVVPRGGRDDLVETSDTLKRLVRITELRDKSHQKINVRSVREAIRNHVATRSVEYVSNYGNVRWSASPATAPTTVFSETDAAEVLDAWWGATTPNAGNRFLRDRLYDFVVEGTPVGQWSTAPGGRSVRLDKDPPSGNRDFIMAALTATGTPLVDYSPRVDFPAPSALDSLHADRATDVGDTKYHHYLSYNEQTQVAYDTRWSAGPMATQTEAEAVGGAWFEYGGQFYAGVTVDGPKDITKPYWLTDPVSGANLRVDDILGFFEKYFQEGSSEALGDSFAEAFDMDGTAQALSDDSSEYTPGSPGSSWDDTPEIVFVPGPPEEVPAPSQGNTKGDEDVGNVIHVSGGGSSSGGSASGGW